MEAYSGGSNWEFQLGSRNGDGQNFAKQSSNAVVWMIVAINAIFDRVPMGSSMDRIC